MKGTRFTGKLAGKMKAASAALKRERGIFRKLKEEHAQVSALMNRIATTEGPDARRDLFGELRRELLSHAKGEEREFYPVFRQYEETADIVEEALEDHTAIEEMVEKLRVLEIESTEWDELFEEVVTEVREHVEQEENELFPLAEKLIDDEQAKHMEERYLHSKEQILRQVA